MGFPARLLGDGEHVELSLRAHVKVLVLPALLLVVAVPVTTYVVAVLPAWTYQSWLRLAVGLVGGGVIWAWSVLPYLRWLASTYVVTNRRIIVRQGLFARVGRDMPLARINDVSFQYSMIERLFRCGTVVIESAGERGPLVLTDVPHVEAVQRAIEDLADPDAARRARGDED
ncbi:MAG: PH domain-containing protein [Actinomycetes bacterium]